MAANKLFEALHLINEWLVEENLENDLQDMTLHFKNKGKQYAALFSVRRSMHEMAYVITEPMNWTVPQEICNIRLRITGAGEDIQLYQQGIRLPKL